MLTKHLRLTVVIIFLLAPFFSLAQGTLKGKIIDDYGMPAPFVNVYLKSNTSIGTQTDFDGFYELKIPDSQEYIVVISAIGKAPQELSFSVPDGEVFCFGYFPAK